MEIVQQNRNVTILWNTASVLLMVGTLMAWVFTNTDCNISEQCYLENRILSVLLFPVYHFV